MLERNSGEMFYYYLLLFYLLMSQVALILLMHADLLNLVVEMHLQDLYLQDIVLPLYHIKSMVFLGIDDSITDFVFDLVCFNLITCILFYFSVQQGISWEAYTFTIADGWTASPYVVRCQSAQI